jgi:hypothetical protein
MLDGLSQDVLQWLRRLSPSGAYGS